MFPSLIVGFVGLNGELLVPRKQRVLKRLQVCLQETKAKVAPRDVALDEY